MYDIVGIFFNFVPFFLCGVCNLGRLSLVYFTIDIVPAFLYSTLHKTSNRCKGLVEEIASSCYVLFDVVGVVDLLFLEIRVMLLDQSF